MEEGGGQRFAAILIVLSKHQLLSEILLARQLLLLDIIIYDAIDVLHMGVQFFVLTLCTEVCLKLLSAHHLIQLE